MPHKRTDSFAVVDADGRIFTLVEIQEFRIDIASGPITERVYGLKTYQTKDGESDNANEDGTFTIVDSGTILRRKA